MINVDISSLIAQFGKDASGLTKESIQPLLPKDAGNSDGWLVLILGCLVVAAIGVGVYTLTCEDGTTAQFKFNKRTAAITKDEPMGPSKSRSND